MAPVTGRFARVLWNAPPKKGGANEPAAEKETPADDDIDPASVPPLDIVVDELRFGDAVFGKAEVHTRPVAGGLRIERLQARAPEQRIDVSGDWLGRGASARTHLKVDVDRDRKSVV